MKDNGLYVNGSLIGSMYQLFADYFRYLITIVINRVESASS